MKVHVCVTLFSEFYEKHLTEALYETELNIFWHKCLGIYGFRKFFSFIPPFILPLATGIYKSKGKLSDLFSITDDVS